MLVSSLSNGIKAYAVGEPDTWIWRGKFTFEVTKRWDDVGNENKRPNQVNFTIDLYGNDYSSSVPRSVEERYTLTLTEADQVDPYTWSKTFTISGTELTDRYGVSTATLTEEFLDNYYGTVTGTDYGYSFDNTVFITQRIGWQWDQVWMWSVYSPTEIITETDPATGEQYRHQFFRADITNHYSEFTEITVNKTWRGEGIIDSGTVNLSLYQNGRFVSSGFRMELDANGQGSTTLHHLPKYDANGDPYVYTVREDSLSSGYSYDYQPIVTGDMDSGYTISNRRRNVELTLYVHKVWEDTIHGETAPEVTVALLRNGEKIDEKTTTNYRTSFTGLPTYDSNGQTYEYTIEELNVPDGYRSSSEYSEVVRNRQTCTITNTPIMTYTDITVRKAWHEVVTPGQPNPEVTIQLFRDGELIDEKETVNYECRFDDLPKHDGNGHDYTYTIGEVDVPDEFYSAITRRDPVDNTHLIEFLVSNYAKRAFYTFRKTWVDGSDHESVSEIGEWEGPDILVDTGNGDPIRYPMFAWAPYEFAGWDWIGEDRPFGENSLTYQLHFPLELDIYVDGKVITDITISESPFYTRWNDDERNAYLAEFSKNFVTEIVENEEVTPYEHNGLIVGDHHVVDIINYIPIDVKVTKTWDDEGYEENRPESIQLRLMRKFTSGYQSEEPVMVQEFALSAADEVDGVWTKTIPDMMKYDYDGNLAEYYIEEVDTGYTLSTNASRIDGVVEDKIIKERDVVLLELTNTIDLKDIEVKKEWNDDDNRDGIRPEQVTVNLLADGKKIDSVELNEDNQWKHTFTNLPTHKNGTEIQYTVEEKKVKGYEASIQDFTITNTHTPETIEISGKKTWKDNNDQDGKRPDEIVVRLFANGKEVASKTVTEKDEWKYTFTSLYKYEDGKEIEYTIQEDEVEGYTTNIDGYNITNTHETIKTPKTPDTSVKNNTWIYLGMLSASGLFFLLKSKKRSTH